MKSLLTSLCLLALSSTAFGQSAYVFTYANGPKNPVGTDIVYGTVPSSVPTIPDAQNHLWDLSVVQIGTYQYNSVFYNLTSFPEANAKFGNKGYVDVAPGISYESDVAFGIDTSGIKIYGERLARQAFSLFAQTGNAADSIIIEAQDVVYSTPQVQLPYPATIGTKWDATSNSTVDLTLKVPSIPLIANAPAQRKTITTSTSEVVGWGLMKIKRLDGKPSGVRAVLQVKTTLSLKDSLYINGQPAPAPLLTSLGVTQGQTNTVYQKNFFREYEMLPLVNVTYSNATYTTIEDVSFHSQRLPFPDNVSEVPNNAIVAKVYPNPGNGIFTIDVAEANESAWSYQVTDITGKVINSNNLDINSNKTKAEVNLSSVLVPGNYILSVQQDGLTVAASKLVIQ